MTSLTMARHGRMQAVGAVVGQVRAVDTEHGQFGVVHYSLSEAVANSQSESQQLLALENFDIDQNTGTITTRRPLDRELVPVYIQLYSP